MEPSLPLKRYLPPGGIEPIITQQATAARLPLKESICCQLGKFFFNPLYIGGLIIIITRFLLTCR